MDSLTGDPYHLQYVDNLGVFGKHRRRVNSMKDIGRELIHSAGLVMHEHEDAVGKPVELLGHVIHPNPPAIRLKASRAWRLGRGAAHASPP